MGQAEKAESAGIETLVSLAQEVVDHIEQGETVARMWGRASGKTLLASEVERILDEGQGIAERIDQEDILLTVSEVAEMVKLHPATVERALRKGDIPGGFQVAGRWRLSRKSYRVWVEERSGG